MVAQLWEVCTKNKGLAAKVNAGKRAELVQIPELRHILHESLRERLEMRE